MAVFLHLQFTNMYDIWNHLNVLAELYIYIYHAKQIGGDENRGKIHKTDIFLDALSFFY